MVAAEESAARGEDGEGDAGGAEEEEGELAAGTGTNPEVFVVGRGC